MRGAREPAKQQYHCNEPRGHSGAATKSAVLATTTCMFATEEVLPAPWPRHSLRRRSMLRCGEQVRALQGQKGALPSLH